MLRSIEDERDWELAAKRQDRANLLKWILLVMAVAIVIVLVLVRAAPSQVVARHPIWQTGARAELSPEILKMVETHCVAVLTTQAVMQVSPYPEQTLKLRCK